MKKIFVISMIYLGCSMSAFADTGVVKWYDQSKGYGMITPDDGGGSVFLHAVDLAVSLYLFPPQQGQCLKFDYEFIDGGKCRAVNVQNCD